MSVSVAPTLLTLPAELRNTIYLYVFESELSSSDNIPPYQETPDALAKALRINISYLKPHTPNDFASNKLRSLRTCRQIHTEAHLLALSMTPFHLHGDCTYPDLFDLRSRSLSSAQIGAIRHITLTAKISNLRALNEAWAGSPFGHPSLKLDTLTIVPKRPDASHSAYAEVADLSQSHTLAYIFAETFKSLRNVREVTVLNNACFNEVVWRLVYRSLVYRMWRWGGERCGITFLSSEVAGRNGKLAAATEHKYEPGQEWFKVFLNGEAGFDVGDEVCRLVGGRANIPADEAGVIVP